MRLRSSLRIGFTRWLARLNGFCSRSFRNCFRIRFRVSWGATRLIWRSAVTGGWLLGGPLPNGYPFILAFHWNLTTRDLELVYKRFERTCIFNWSQKQRGIIIGKLSIGRISRLGFAVWFWVSAVGWAVLRFLVGHHYDGHAIAQPRLHIRR